MMQTTQYLLAASLSTMMLAGACSPQTSDAPAEEIPATQSDMNSPLTQASPSQPPSAENNRGQKEQAIDRFTGLRIGSSSLSGGWAPRGAQTGGDCVVVSSPDYPGVYAIVLDGTVERVTVGQRSDQKLAGGVAVGSTEAEVRAAFPDLTEEPNKYVDPPAKYLTRLTSDNEPGIRFEVDVNREVSSYHVGRMPALGYVEGCA